MARTQTKFGPVVNDISGMGDTHELLGGHGGCRWKQLINGMHLNGPWNCVEYVVIPPGASCGAHTQVRTDEIYYILSGTAEMECNGEAISLGAGDLMTAPTGTLHGTVNESDEDMEFLVVEIFPGLGEAPAPVRISVMDARPADAVSVSNCGAATLRTVDLAGLFTGTWRSFAAIEVAPSATASRDVVPDGDEVLFVTEGLATIEFGGAAADGGRGLCVGVPPDTERAIVNRSDSEPLTVLSTIVGLE